MADSSSSLVLSLGDIETPKVSLFTETKPSKKGRGKKRQAEEDGKQDAKKIAKKAEKKTKGKAEDTKDGKDGKDTNSKPKKPKKGVVYKPSIEAAQWLLQQDPVLMYDFVKSSSAARSVKSQYYGVYKNMPELLEAAKVGMVIKLLTGLSENDFNAHVQVLGPQFAKYADERKEKKKAKNSKADSGNEIQKLAKAFADASEKALLAKVKQAITEDSCNACEYFASDAETLALCKVLRQTKLKAAAVA